ncbi:unnamed protein product [Closterium sp. NIES-65]|nr:unnamed protein product [Closterium sp. NIES-65]
MLTLMGDTSSRVAARRTWNARADFPPLADLPPISMQDEAVTIAAFHAVTVAGFPAVSIAAFLVFTNREYRPHRPQWQLLLLAAYSAIDIRFPLSSSHIIFSSCCSRLYAPSHAPFPSFSAIPSLLAAANPEPRPARTEHEGPIYGSPGGSVGRDTWQQYSAPGGSTSASPSAAAAAIAAARAASARKSRGYGQAGRSSGSAYNGSSRGSPKKGGRGGKGFPYNSSGSSSGAVVTYPPFSPRAVLDSSRAIARNESALSDASSEGSSGVDAQGVHLLELTCGWQDLSHIPNVQVTGGVSRPAVCSVKEKDDEEEAVGWEGEEDNEEALPSQEEFDAALC